MQLREITFVSWGFPPKVVKKPNKDTVKFLTFLLNSKIFNDLISEYIEEYNIEVRDVKPFINYLNEQVTNLFDNVPDKLDEKIKSLVNQWMIDYLAEEEDILPLVKNLGLPIEFVFDFYLLANYKAFRNIKKLPWIDYQKNVSEICEITDNCEESYKTIGAITIEHQVTKQELHNWIDDHWKYIEAGMKEELPLSPIFKTDFADLQLTN